MHNKLKHNNGSRISYIFPYIAARLFAIPYTSLLGVLAPLAVFAKKKV